MNINKILGFGLTGVLALTSVSCNDFLDKEPMSEIAPESYYSSESQLNAILMDEYNATLPGHGAYYGFYGGDDGTDNQINPNCPARHLINKWATDTGEGSWSWYRIYYINFALQQILPRYGEALDGSQNTIDGSLATIQHHIGEFYFLRAYQYFSKVRALGDFPIVLEPVSIDEEKLKAATKRSPRNEVVRQILDDLDKAIYLMSFTNLGTTRISRDVALQFKSRVALNEATWLKYFKGTAFVPGGEGWPGEKTYPNYQYPSGSIDNEVNFFLDQAIAAAKEIGDKYVDRLTPNTGKLQQSVDDPANEYYNMFGATDMSGYPEIIFWRQYSSAYARHDVCLQSAQGNGSIGLTRMYVQNFLMEDGTPVYTHGTYADGDGYYLGDKTLANVKMNRDSRLSIFLKAPGELNFIYDLDYADGFISDPKEKNPDIATGGWGNQYVTGYCIRKGGNMSRRLYVNQGCYTGCPIMRATESLLNYMEAYYERHGQLDETAERYWKAIRKRAHVSEDIYKTIAQTDMAKEAENDWGAYSGGTLIDPTLYNIRRERRCEFLSEGRRYPDLMRWRSMDQLIENPCHMEGFHLWNTPMEKWYGKKDLISGKGSKSKVSSKVLSEYLRPFEKYEEQDGYNGLTWRMAHYLEPVSIKQILLSTPDGTNAEESIIYQNPYWPLSGMQYATK